MVTDKRCPRGTLQTRARDGRKPGDVCRDDLRFTEQFGKKKESSEEMQFDKKDNDKKTFFFDTDQRKYFTIENCKVDKNLKCDITPGQDLNIAKQIAEK